MKDLELVQAAKMGDLNAFNEIVLGYQDQAFNLAYHILGNQNIAEDVSQDAFILAFKKIHQFRGGSFKAWLLKIVTNLCYSEIRTWKRNTFQGLEQINSNGDTNESPEWIRDPKPSPEEEIESNEMREILDSTMNKLPSVYRTALSLVDIHAFNYREAASIMGISIGTVKSRLARGRTQLRTILLDIDPQYISNLGFAATPEMALLPSKSK